LRCHGVTAEPEQIRHRISGKVEVADMLRCAKELGLKARCGTSPCDRSDHHDAAMRAGIASASSRMLLPSLAIASAIERAASIATPPRSSVALKSKFLADHSKTTEAGFVYVRSSDTVRQIKYKFLHMKFASEI
jgi:hypothetical protein